RAIRDHQLEHFEADALGRERYKARPGVDASQIAGAIGFAGAIGGMNAEEAQDAQIILRDPLVWVSNETHASCGYIIQTADVVVHPPRSIDRQAVDGEVAPLRITLPVAPEGDLRLAAERLGVLAQGRDLERMRIDHQRHRAVLDAGRHALDAGCPGATDYLFGNSGGRDIDVTDRDVQQRVADGAADHARFFAVAVQEIQHTRGSAGFEPG